MEKFLQSIVRRFIKRVDPNKIQLKEVDKGKASDWGIVQDEENSFLHVYKIKYNRLTIGTVVTLINEATGTKYLSNIDIIAPFRSLGIGGYVLKHYFSGYYIMADNSRASRLYARIGKAYNKFTRKEFEEFIDMCGMKGVYKLDRQPNAALISDAHKANTIYLKKTKAVPSQNGYDLYFDIMRDNEKIGKLREAVRNHDIEIRLWFKPGQNKAALKKYIIKRYFSHVKF